MALSVLAVPVASFLNVRAKAPASVSEWYFLAYWNSLKYGVPVEIILAVLWQESAGNPDAIGDGGASYGLMQIKQIAIQDLINRGYNVEGTTTTNPGANVSQGAAFLSLLRRNVDSWEMALRAYNATGTNFARLRTSEILGKVYAQKVLNKAKRLGFNYDGKK